MTGTTEHSAPSIDSTSTNIAPSDHSTPAMSDQINDDLEKGQEKTTEPTEIHDAKLEPPEKSDAGPSGPPGPGPPPDGGIKAWTVVLGGFCGLFVSFGWINCKPWSTSYRAGWRS